MPREGISLLGGLIFCAQCGHRMAVHYGSTRRAGVIRAVTGCEQPGERIDWVLVGGFQSATTLDVRHNCQHLGGFRIKCNVAARSARPKWSAHVHFELRLTGW